MSVHKSQVTSQLKRRKKFAQVPNELFAADIPIQARLVWAYLMSEGPGWDSSVANIARNLGISRSAATRSVRELRDRNMISTRQTKSGTDFTMHTSDQWNVEWLGEDPLALTANDAINDSPECSPVSTDQAAADFEESTGLPQFKARAVSSEGGIQHSNTFNTVNTTDRERSGSMATKKHDFRSEEKNWWHLHFLKSSAIEKFFLQLSTEDQKSLRYQFSNPGFKDEFVSAMTSRMFSNTQPFDPDSLVIDLQ